MLPLNLVLKNFLSHDHSEIDFSKFDSALIVGVKDGNADQSNGAGKSALFEAIMWALFGKSRHKKTDGVVKTDKRRCTVAFTFSVDNETFRVTRKRDKVLQESDVVLERLRGSSFESISCDTNTATNNKITKIININSDVFLNSIYFKQNDISMFAEASPAKRKDIVKSLLKMDRWDAYQKNASKKASNLKSIISEKESRVVDLKSILNQIEECKAEISKLNSDRKECRANYEKISGLLLEKSSEYQSIQSSKLSPEDLKKIKVEYSNAKSRVKEINNLLNKNNLEIQKKESYTNKLKQKLVEYNNAIRQVEDIDIDKMRNGVFKGDTKAKLLHQQIKDIESKEYVAGVCPECEKPLSQHDAASLEKKQQDRLSDLRSKHSEILDKLKRAKAKLSESEKLVALSSEAQLNIGKVNLKLNNCKNDIDNAISENARLEKEKASILSRDYEAEIDKLEQLLDKEKIVALKKELDELSSKKQSLEKKIDNINIRYGSKVNSKKDLEQKYKDQESLQAHIKKLKEDFSIYDRLKFYFGKDGVQAVIIENVISELENYANDILSRICNEPTSITVNTQKQSDSGSWSETFDILINSENRSDEFSTFSGGEQFRVSLALRLALSKILSKRMGGTLKFLLLDEVSSSLDAKGRAMFIDIVKRLSQNMKILVITHDDKLKESFDDIILVNKGPTGSTVSMSN